MGKKLEDVKKELPPDTEKVVAVRISGAKTTVYTAHTAVVIENGTTTVVAR